jgi:penicillin-binding protein 1A
VLDALRRARAARHGAAAAPEGGEEGFVEEQGGIY